MADAGEKPRDKKTYKYKVDDSLLEHSEPKITGRQIKESAGVSLSYQLFLEVPGEAHEDKQVQDEESVDLSRPGLEKFYALPVATFGNR